MSEVNPYAPPQTEITAPEVQTQGKPLARKRDRLFAQIVDALISVAIIFPLQYLTGSYGRIAASAAQGHYFNFESLLWIPLGLGVLFALNWKHLAVGQTIGKRALGIRIVRKSGAAIDRKTIIVKRLLPVWLVAQVPFLGSALVLVDTLCIFRAGNNTLHDDIADTKVVVA